MSEHVQLTVEDGVGVVRLDRPPVNALNRTIREDLITVAETLTAREDVRAFVVHGGPKTFAAGADVRELIDLRNPVWPRRRTGSRRAWERSRPCRNRASVRSPASRSAVAWKSR